MARIKHVTLSGSMQKVTFYTVRGKSFARLKAENVKQTEATKESAKLFGKATKISAGLRRGLPSAFKPKEKTIMYQVNKAVYKWLQYQPVYDRPLIIDPDPIYKLNFHENTFVRRRIRVGLSVDWQTQGMVYVIIPAFIPVKDISAPAKTIKIYWTITITGCTINENPGFLKSFSNEIEISYNDSLVPAQQIEFPYELFPDNLYIVALSMRCETTRYGQPVEVKDKRWLPAGVIGSCFVR